MTWRERLRKEIDRRGVSDKEFAKAIGINAVTLSKYLNDAQTPGAKFFERLRHAGVSLDWLFTGEGNPDADADMVMGPAGASQADILRLLKELEDLTARYRADTRRSGGKLGESSDE